MKANQEFIREAAKSQKQEASKYPAPDALTQDQCDTAKAEYEVMTKAINEGSNNRKNSVEYLKVVQKVESCKKAGFIE